MSTEPAATAVTPQTPLARHIGMKFHQGCVFDGFVPTLAADLQGWNSTHPALRRMVQETRAELILDVGVWKGLSTIFLAKAQKQAGIQGAVISIDTFLGSPEHWNFDRPDRIHESLRFRHGMPGFYWQFMANIVSQGCQDSVVPLAQTAENACVLLRRHRLFADLIHIDAAHEYDAVLGDCRRFWQVLKPGGVLVGDDFSWKSVEDAARAFAAEIGQPLEVESPKWIIRKPRG